MHLATLLLASCPKLHLSHSYAIPWFMMGKSPFHQAMSIRLEFNLEILGGFISTSGSFQVEQIVPIFECGVFKSALVIV